MVPAKQIKGFKESVLCTCMFDLRMLVMTAKQEENALL